MTPTQLLILLSLFLAYAVFRAVVYFRSKRPAFGIAVCFVIAIVLFEMSRLILDMVAI